MVILATVLSVNRKLIRLTAERWQHISENHSELSGLIDEVVETIRQPEKVLSGRQAELLALHRSKSNPRHYLVVVYRERKLDGFIITAFKTSKLTKLLNAYPKSHFPKS